MNADDKLQVARLLAFGLSIILASLIWAYSAELSDMLHHQTTQFLGDSYGHLDAVVRR